MDWKSVVSTVAPWLGSALGGPLGAAAVEVVGGALGLSDKSVSTVQKALMGATPEQLLALKQADNDFAVKMRELGIHEVEQLISLGNSDRDSARKREMEVKDNVPRNLAYTLLVGFFAVMGFLMFATVPVGSRDLLNILLGMLGTSVVSVVSYYFGSSQGSAEKTKLLAKADAIKE